MAGIGSDQRHSSLPLAEVDVRTGFVKLLQHWAVDDFGVIVNPLLVSEQVRGGIAQGIGQALYEELVYSPEGQLTNGTFADYFIPAAADLLLTSLSNMSKRLGRTPPLAQKGRERREQLALSAQSSTPSMMPFAHWAQRSPKCR